MCIVHASWLACNSKPQLMTSLIAMQAAAERCLEFMCARFTDPVYFGDYPKSIRDRIPSLPTFTPEQQAQLKGSVDFFLINHYSTKYVSHKADASGEDGMSLFDGASRVEHTERKGKLIGPQVRHGSSVVELHSRCDKSAVVLTGSSCCRWTVHHRLRAHAGAAPSQARCQHTVNELQIAHTRPTAAGLRTNHHTQYVQSTQYCS